MTTSFFDPAALRTRLREQHNDEQNQRQPHNRPGQFVPHMVIHQAGGVHGRYAQRRKQ